MIDWNVALQTATRLSRPGPELSRAEAEDVVAELRRAAAASEGPVRAFTGLHAPSGADSDAPVLVVDRDRWIEANLTTFRALMEPVLERVAVQTRGAGPLTRAVGGAVSGVEVGALVSFLSGKVLGQFDPFWDGLGPDGVTAGAGRLLLVAPNIVQAERQLGVDPHDFRLWVCLHEETHRVQFTAVPWLGDHLRGLVGEFVDAAELDSQALATFLTDGAGELLRIMRGTSEASLADLFQNERQRDVVDAMTGVMSLLEGHADVVMDGVGPDVIPTVAHIRRRFQQRRKGGGGLDRLLRRLMGLETKMRQYRDGAVFVRTVVDAVGMEGFNRVWDQPANLPTKAEILEPALWLARVPA